jgi:hypothetical protein
MHSIHRSVKWRSDFFYKDSSRVENVRKFHGLDVSKAERHGGEAIALHYGGRGTGVVY